MAAESKVTPERTRSVFWRDDKLYLIDQPKLPQELVFATCSTVEEVATSIRTMVVRGAPAIGAAGGFGIAIAAKASSGSTSANVLSDLRVAKTELDVARPTAVNLTWATSRMVEFAERLVEAEVTPAILAAALLQEAQALADQDVAINTAMSVHGAALVPPRCSVIHHCNTGSLATVDVGTALGVITQAHKQGKGVHCYVDETRPRLQGARLTAWELLRDGVPCHLMADSAAGSLLRSGKVAVVLFGADRVAANGDVANKIGSYPLAVVARENGVAVYAVVPTSTIDLSCPTGDGIAIEERGAEEVTCIRGSVVAPEGVPVFNPAFDVTPQRYISGIVTEHGVCYPPFSLSLAAAKRRGEESVRQAWEERLAAAVAAAAPPPRASSTQE